LLAGFSGEQRLFGMPEIGVRARSLPHRWHAGLSRWLDDGAFSFPAPGITRSIAAINGGQRLAIHGLTPSGWAPPRIILFSIPPKAQPPDGV